MFGFWRRKPDLPKPVFLIFVGYLVFAKALTHRAQIEWGPLELSRSKPTMPFLKEEGIWV